MDTISEQSGEPAGPGTRRERRWLGAAAAVMAGLLLGITGIAVASDTSPSTPTPSPGAAKTAEERAATKEEREARAKARAERKAQRAAQGRGNGQGRNGGKHFRGGPNAALHGEFVVPAGDGKFETLVVQRGTVTAVTAKSITLKSDDGFSRTYAINADTKVKARGGGIAAIEKGNYAHVSAIEKGGTFRAQLVQDRPAPGLGQTKPKPKPSPTSSGAAT